MPLFGPRLDRPSVIGEEGRPRATSLWIATLVVVVLVGVGGAAIGQPDLLFSLGTVVGGTVAGAGLLNRDRFVPLLAGHFLFFLFGSLLVVWMLVTVVVTPFGLAIAGLAVAMTGIGVSWANVSTVEGLQNTLLGASVTYVALLLGSGLVLAVLVVLLAGEWLLAVTTAGVSPGVALTWFLLVVGYATGAFRVLLWRLPFEQLTPYHRRPARTARLRRLGRVALVVTGLTPVAIVAVWIGMAAGLFATLQALAPPVAVALDALATPWVLGALAVVGTVELGVAVVAVLLRAATRRFDATTARVVGAAAAGGLLTVLLVTAVLAALAAPAYSTLGTALVLFAAVNVGPLTLMGVAVVGVLAVAVGVFPDRAGGPAVAATGLAIATTWFGRAPPWLVFGCAAGTLVVWDVSAYGLGLTAELGHLPETRRLELFHGILVVGIGAATALVLTGVELLRVGLSGPGGTTATFVAGIGVLLLLLPLRG